MLEAKVETYLYEQVESRGGLCIKLNPLWYFGIPDRLVLLPGGLAIFVETKTQGGSVKKHQARWHQKLRGLGFRVAVLWDMADIDNFFRGR